MDDDYLFSFVSLFTLFLMMYHTVLGKIPESSKEKLEKSLYIIVSQAFVTPLYFFFCSISFSSSRTSL